ncbi:hypothetical protein BRADI_2g38124v3 [Brachypodium distachyon]|uniref:Uncharacterized protein n=1 Tax=Brachypodium distachyon TaxID=15368 RepID=A0A2K2DCI0_BRADI|nr:hypothetical protein BRADI_2g38124v3 [Brachypodium distachyon]PNT71989.1 hypothetical protein BRADI_2g38124v3 [Brachypodium distachyon]
MLRAPWSGRGHRAIGAVEGTSLAAEGRGRFASRAPIERTTTALEGPLRQRGRGSCAGGMDKAAAFDGARRAAILGGGGDVRRANASDGALERAENRRPRRQSVVRTATTTVDRSVWGRRRDSIGTAVSTFSAWKRHISAGNPTASRQRRRG